MTTEDVQAKLAEFEARTQRAIAYRDQAQEQARQAEIGVHQLQGACAVLRELLTAANPAVNGNGLAAMMPAINATLNGSPNDEPNAG